MRLEILLFFWRIEARNGWEVDWDLTWFLALIDAESFREGFGVYFLILEVILAQTYKKFEMGLRVDEISK